MLIEFTKFDHVHQFHALTQFNESHTSSNPGAVSYTDIAHFAIVPLVI